MIQHKISIGLLIVIFNVIPQQCIAYAWTQNKTSKYKEISVKTSTDYESYFQDSETTECQKFNFADRTKIYSLSNYSEKGLTPKITWISKVNLNYYSSQLMVETTENNPIEWPSYYINAETEATEFMYLTQPTYVDCVENKKITGEKKFLTIESEFGLRTLLHKTDTQSIASDIILIPPNVGSKLNGYTNPSIRINLAIGGKIPIPKYNKHFYEIMLGSQSNNLKNKLSFFSQIILGFNIFKENTLIIGYEKIILDQINTERFIYQNEYNKLLKKHYKTHQEGLQETINKHILPNKKTNNNKIFFKLLIPINKKNGFGVSAYREWKSQTSDIDEKPSYYMQFSFIRKIN